MPEYGAERGGHPGPEKARHSCRCGGFRAPGQTADLRFTQIVQVGWFVHESEVSAGKRYALCYNLEENGPGLFEKHGAA